MSEKLIGRAAFGFTVTDAVDCCTTTASIGLDLPLISNAAGVELFLIHVHVLEDEDIKALVYSLEKLR